MDIRKLQRTIVDGLEDVKAQDIAVFNTEQLSALFERVVVASGTSNRQTKALAASVRDAVREQGGTVLSVEGEDNGEWIIVDCGAAVVHIMQPAIRQYYHLEEIWGAKPVRMKLGGEARGLPKASASDEDEAADDDAVVVPAAKPAARRRASSAAEAKAPARKAAVKRSTGGVGDAAAAKPAAKKAPAKAAGKTVARKTPARKTAAAAPVPVVVVPPPKSAARKTATKTAARKAPARKTAAPRKSKPAA